MMVCESSGMKTEMLKIVGDFKKIYMGREELHPFPNWDRHGRPTSRLSSYLMGGWYRRGRHRLHGGRESHDSVRQDQAAKEALSIG